MNRLSQIACLCLGLGFALAGPAFGAVVVIGGSTNNGNLDRTHAVEIVEDFFLPKPDLWQNVGSRAISGPTEDDLQSEPWAGPAPTPVTTDGNLNPPHPEGCGGADCGVFFKPFAGNVANGAITAHLYQDAPGAPGPIYRLTGWAGAEANMLATGVELALEFLDVSLVVIGGSGQVVQLLPTLQTPNGQPFSYKRYSAYAKAPAGTVYVRSRVSLIQGLANPAGGGQALVVDDFVLTRFDNLFADGFESGNTNAWS